MQKLKPFILSAIFIVLLLPSVITHNFALEQFKSYYDLFSAWLKIDKQPYPFEFNAKWALILSSYFINILFLDYLNKNNVTDFLKRLKNSFESLSFLKTTIFAVFIVSGLMALIYYPVYLFLSFKEGYNIWIYFLTSYVILYLFGSLVKTTVICFINKNKIDHKVETNPSNKVIYYHDLPQTYDDLSSTQEGYINSLHSIIENHAGTQYLSIALNSKWGNGKTTILKALEKKLIKDYEIININFWELKNPKNVIQEIENNLQSIFNKVYLPISINDGMDFFKFFLDIYNSKLSNFLNFLKINPLDDLGKVKVKLNKIIDKYLVKTNKKKIIILFDDLDRITEREDIISFLKVICYIVGLEKVVSLTAVDKSAIRNIITFDIEKIAYKTEVNDETNTPKDGNLIHVKKIIENQCQVFNCNNYVDKIFNITIDLSETKSNLMRFVIKERDNIRQSITSFNFEDSDSINTDISTLLTYYAEEIFNNYRELKLSLNFFYAKLSAMTNLNKPYKLQDKIHPATLFLLCVLKTKYNVFFETFIHFYATIGLKSQIITDFLRTNLTSKYNETYISLDLSSNSILNIFNLLGFRVVANNQKSILSSSDKNNLGNPQTMKFFLNPHQEFYSFNLTQIKNNIAETAKNPNQAKELLFNLILEIYMPKNETEKNDLNLFLKNMLKTHAKEILERLTDYLIHLQNEDLTVAYLESLFFSITEIVFGILKKDSSVDKYAIEEIVVNMLKVYSISSIRTEKYIEYSNIIFANKQNEFFDSIFEYLNDYKIYFDESGSSSKTDLLRNSLCRYNLLTLTDYADIRSNITKNIQEENLHQQQIIFLKNLESYLVERNITLKILFGILQIYCNSVYREYHVHPPKLDSTDQFNKFVVYFFHLVFRAIGKIEDLSDADQYQTDDPVYRYLITLLVKLVNYDIDKRNFILFEKNQYLDITNLEILIGFINKGYDLESANVPNKYNTFKYCLTANFSKAFLALSKTKNEKLNTKMFHDSDKINIEPYLKCIEAFYQQHNVYATSTKYDINNQELSIQEIIERLTKLNDGIKNLYSSRTSVQKIIKDGQKLELKVEYEDFPCIVLNSNKRFVISGLFDENGYNYLTENNRDLINSDITEVQYNLTNYLNMSSENRTVKNSEDIVFDDFHVGLINYLHGLYFDVILFFKNAIENEKTDILINNLAMAHYKMYDLELNQENTSTEKADFHINESIRLLSSIALDEAKINLAFITSVKKNKSFSLELARKLLVNYESRSSEVLFNLGRLYLFLDEKITAMQVIKKAIEKDHGMFERVKTQPDLMAIASDPSYNTFINEIEEAADNYL